MRLVVQELAKTAAPWCVLGLGLFFALQPMFVSGFRDVPGDLGDTRLVHYSLEHAHRFLLRDLGHRELWDPPLFYPARNVAAFTDTMFLLVPLYSPWRWLGFSPVTAFQLWLVVVFGLNFWAFHSLARRGFALGRWPAAAGAYLYAFGSPRMSNIEHPQLIPAFFPILTVFALVKIFDSKDGTTSVVRRVWIGVFFLSLVLQLWSAVYPAFFLVLMIGLAFLLGLGFSDGRRALKQMLWGEKWAWGIGAFIAFVLLLPLLQRYGLTADLLGERPWVAHERNIPSWPSWLLMGGDNWLFGGMQNSKWVLTNGDSVGGDVRANGLGVVTLCLVALGLYSRRKSPTVLLLVGVLALSVLSTTRLPGGMTLWRVFYNFIPGASAIRMPGRVGLVLLIPFSLGLAFFYQGIQRTRFHGMLIPFLFAATVAEHRHLIPHFDREISLRRIAAVTSALRPGCKSFFVSTLHKRPEHTIHEDAMWASLASGVPTINGRYGNFPLGWKLFEVNRQPGDKDRLEQIGEFLGEWMDFNCLDPRGVCWVEVDSFRRKGELLPVPGSNQEKPCGGD